MHEPQMNRRPDTRLTLVPLILLALGGYLSVISPLRWSSLLVLLLGSLQCAWLLLTRRFPDRSHVLQGRLRSLRSWLGLSEARASLLLLGTGMTIAARSAAGDSPRVVSWLALPLWVGGIACTLFALRGHHTAPRRAGTTDRLEWLALALLTLAAFILRAWRIESMPYVLSGDEGSAGLTAIEFVNGARSNPLGLGWFSFPALYFWLLAGAQLLFGRTIFAIRIVSALIGALAVPATYWLLKGFFGRRAGWLGTLWLACFHVQLFFSRLAYNNIFDSLAFTLILAALWDGAKNRRRNSYLMAGLFLGLSQYFYTTAHVIPLLLVAWAGLIALSKCKPEGFWPDTAAAGIVALNSFMPLMLLYLAHPDEILFTASRVSMLVPGWIEPAAAALGTTPLGLILEQIWVTGLGISAAELQGVYYGSGVPLLFGLSTPFLYLGLLYSIWHLRDARFSLPVLTLLATLIIGGLSIQAPNAQRMLLLPPVLAMLIVIPIDQAVKWLRRRAVRLTIPAVLFAFGLVLVMGAQNLTHLFGRYLPQNEYGSLNGEVTMGMIQVLREEPYRQPVYFVGGDRMSFYSIPSLPYLLPDVEGVDLDDPFILPKGTTQSDQPQLVFVLPEQTLALEVIHERYSPGELRASYNRRGQLLFYLYRFGGK
jgi:4-amino-4-deoxy-L-arabinose transferase-like glycosyltransferase